MRKIKRKKLIWAAAFLLLLCIFTGCGYSFGELEAIQRYRSQGRKNAEAYIEEKYGFKAKVVSAKCEYLVGDIDFSPPPSGNVFVTMEYDGHQFLVKIPGDEKTTEGKDNYQYEEICVAMEQALYDITGVPAEDVFLFYGYYWDFADVNVGRNGLISTYFDGKNLLEVLSGEQYKPAVWAVYADRDLADIDMEAVREQLKVDSCQLVNYSRDYYNLLMEKYAGEYWIAGVTCAENNLPYVKSYWCMDYDEVTYVESYLTEKDGILVYTEHAGDEVSIETEVPNKNQELIQNLNKMYGFSGSNIVEGETLLLDTYNLRSDADCVHIYIPVELWAEADMDFREIDWEFWSPAQTIHQSWDYTDDRKYIQTTLYLGDHEYVSFRVVAKEK